jgi:hypothetical protein
MSRYISNVFARLRILADKKTSRKVFKTLVDDPAYQEDLFKSIAEIFHNILHGGGKVIQLSPIAKKLLKDHRKVVEKLATSPPKTNRTAGKYRALLLKYGNVLLPALLPPALQVLKDLV